MKFPPKAMFSTRSFAAWIDSSSPEMWTMRSALLRSVALSGGTNILAPERCCRSFNVLAWRPVMYLEWQSEWWTDDEANFVPWHGNADGIAAFRRCQSAAIARLFNFFHQHWARRVHRLHSSSDVDFSLKITWREVWKQSKTNWQYLGESSCLREKNQTWF